MTLERLTFSVAGVARPYAYPHFFANNQRRDSHGDTVKWFFLANPTPLRGSFTASVVESTPRPWPLGAFKTTLFPAKKMWVNLALIIISVASTSCSHQADSGAQQEQRGPPTAEEGDYHVHPGEDIQSVLDAAAENSKRKRIIVHGGTYRPQQPGQAMIWFNGRHDGITLEAEGEVILTAANPEIADSSTPSYPAVVNHVVYFGDGVSRKTVLRGFKITGANGFLTTLDEPANIQPEIQLKPAQSFFESRQPDFLALQQLVGFFFPTAKGFQLVDQGAFLLTRFPSGIAEFLFGASHFIGVGRPLRKRRSSLNDTETLGVETLDFALQQFDTVRSNLR